MSQHPTATTLSESDSKSLLSSFGVPFAAERKVSTGVEAVAAGDDRVSSNAGSFIGVSR